MAHLSATVCWGSIRNRDCILYLDVGTFVLIRPTQTFYERIKVGLLIPTAFAGQPPSLREFTDFFRRADDAGLHSLWVIYRVFHENPVFDPLTILACAATVTNRIRLGTGVFLLVLRNPVLAAKAAATLDYLSGGRLTLGVSLEGRDHEFQGLGVSIKERVGRFREALTLMRKLWSEDKVTFDGRYNHVEGVTVEPKPVQKPHIPIIMGGSNEAVLKRTGELADGWIAGGGGDPQTVSERWQKIRDYARAAGRDPEELDSAKLMYTYVDDNRDAAREKLTAFTHAYYGRFDVEQNCVFGPAQEYVAKIQGFIDAGIKTVVLGPPWPDVVQVQRIAEQVAPNLR